MPLLIQDALVTALAVGAVGLVARRVLGVFKPPPVTPVCTSCSSCPAPRSVPEDNATPVPVMVRKKHVGGQEAEH